jgi:hypothetical protein
MANLHPILSSSPIWASTGENFSWITIENDIPRQLYAQAVYNVNNGNNYDKTNPAEPTVSSTIGTVLSANPVRKALFCRNLSDANELYIKMGPNASNTSFHVVLKHSDDGLGEMFFDEQVYMGLVSVYGVDPNYILWEGY